MRKIIILLFFLVPLLLPSKIFSQRGVLDPVYYPDFYLGIIGGYGLNTHTGTYTTLEGTTECGTFIDGTGGGPIFGLYAEFPFSRKLSLVFNLLYEDRSGTFNSSFQEAPVFVGDNKPLEQGKLEQSMEAKLGYLTFSPLIKYRLFRFGMGVMAGPSFNFLISNSITHTETILSPASLIFLSGSKSRTVVSGEVQSKNSLLIDLKGGLYFEVPVSKKWTLIPQVFATFPLMKVTSGTDWKVSTIQFLFCLRYGFSN